jgi:hypothetical protein
VFAIMLLGGSLKRTGSALSPRSAMLAADLTALPPNWAIAAEDPV